MTRTRTRTRTYGNVRLLPSGKYQMRYRDLEGQWHAGGTFATKEAADEALAGTRTDIKRGDWIDPQHGKETLAGYAEEWYAGRVNLRPSTLAKYRSLLDNHILAEPPNGFGGMRLADLKPSKIQAWHARIDVDHPATAAGAYRLLATICRAAVGDKMLTESPCKVKGASTEESEERPTLTKAQVARAINNTPEPEWRLAILLASYCGLRRGEVLGLQRQDVSLPWGKLRVDRAVVVAPDGHQYIGKPKSKASRREVVIPPNVLQVLAAHLENRVPDRKDAWVVTDDPTRPGRAKQLERAWHRARLAIRRPDIRLHDLRHSGLTWLAHAGATTRELMAHAGHSHADVAIRYQHVDEDRGRELANRMAEQDEAVEEQTTVVPLRPAAGTPG